MRHDCIFGENFEKLIYGRLYSYLATKGILYEKQFGFRKSHSVSEVNEFLYENKHVIGIYIDLSKAFDTIYHDTIYIYIYIYIYVDYYINLTNAGYVAMHICFLRTIYQTDCNIHMY